MATVASFNTANPGNASSITVTKPTGLSVGDLMIFHYSYSDGTDNAETISGWTHEVANYGAIVKTGLQYKVADSGDVAASNFTMSFEGVVGYPLAALLRITDYSTDGLLNENKATATNGSTTLTMTVTPASASSLMLFFLANNEGLTTETYAVTTDNPSWGEEYDIQASSTALACASAVRTEISATGNASFTYGAGGSGNEDFFGILVSIGSSISVNPSVSVVSATTSVISPTVTGGATASPSVVDVTTSVVSPTVSFPQDLWTNQSKNSSNWTNQNKS